MQEMQAASGAPSLPPTGDVGARLLKGEQRFFEAQPLAPKEQPHRIMRDLHPARRQLVLQPMQRQVRRLVVRPTMKSWCGSRTRLR